MMYFKRGRTTAVILGGILCLLVLGASVQSALASPSSQGSATAAFLKLDPAAESAGAGSAYLGRANELSAYFNPAGLSHVDETRAVVSENDIFAGITYRYLSVTARNRQLNGGVGLSVTNLDFGSQDRTRVSGDNPITGLGNFSAGDLAFTASYGGKLTDRLSIGSNLKYVQSEIAGFQDGTFTGDMGLHLDPDVSGLQFGFSARNLFGSLKLNRKSDPLPRVFEFGGNYDYRWSPGRHEFQFGFGIGTARDSDEYFFSGLTYELFGVGSLRVGHNGSQEADDGFTFGLGLHYAGVKIDYAYVPFGDLGRQQRFSLSLGFGGSEDPTGETRVDDRKRKSAGDDEFKVGREASLYKAIEFYQEGNYQDSYGILRRLRNEYPENIDVLLRLGQVQRELGDTVAAQAQFEKVLELDPDNSRARKMLDQLKETDKPKSVEALLEQGRQLLGDGKLERSRRLLQKAHAKAPQNTDVLYWLARAEYQLGYANQARDRLLKILELNPSSERARRTFMRMD